MSGITHTVAINIVHHVLIFRQYVYIQVNKVESEYFSRYEKKNAICHCHRCHKTLREVHAV